jgi:UDP-N-acetylglucosamine--N-acetylmuramyl-(pentapeptide) pyrophosphoryl-undecaprenol N-acetylglucosamine transferase
MTTYLLAGGGTAGHVNPLLAVADRIRAREPESTVLVLGTAEGLESRLVPLRGYELLTVERLPFPRRPNAAALRFPTRLARSRARVVRLLRERGVDLVIGFGGYAAAPAYLAARGAGIPFALHEANAMPGIANRLGARLSRSVGVAFQGTALPNARFVGMPLRREIERLDVGSARADARRELGLDPDRRTLLVTGGSLGARRINHAVHASAAELVATGAQVLHIQGGMTSLEDPGVAGYTLLDYCDRMELALASADLVLSRSGAGTVSEISALGLPAVYVPYPVGNGEQRFNARDAIAAGAARIVEDALVTPEWVRGELLPLLGDDETLAAMAAAAAATGVRDGADRMLDLALESLAAHPQRSGAENGSR